MLYFKQTAILGFNYGGIVRISLTKMYIPVFGWWIYI